MVPGFGVSAECQSIGTSGKKQRACYLAPKTLSWCQSIGTSGKKQRAVARSRGLVIQPQKLLVGAYFELSFLGCGFLIHLSNRSDSPRFWAPRHQTRAPWLGPPRLKKAKSNFFTNCYILHTLKNEPLNIMLLHTSRRMDGSRGLVFSPQNSQLVHILSFHSQAVVSLFIFSNRSDSPRFRAPWKKIRQKYGTRQEPSLFKGHPLSCQYGEALCSMVHS